MTTENSLSSFKRAFISNLLIKHIYVLYQNYSSKLDPISWLNIPLSAYGLYGFSNSGVYSAFGWDLKLLCNYQGIETLISSYISWSNNLQLLILAVECTSYSSLTSGDRKNTYSATPRLCDNDLNGWFRFQGAAVARRTTSCPLKSRCNTNAASWLNGGHPTVVDGNVTRQVCSHWYSNFCYRSRNIEVRNCGSVYVSGHLSGVPATYNLRYCGSD